ncbi:cobalt-precorrin-6A reductase [Candidatus Clostridium radicumherbarum]|uniref:Cobalt-precorrin-6A reductase n=1 Tax=Candidatus Clostridium radicumherbarum TaxID=3381662 RepID=A0ABW8TT56_9CLOT
MIGLILGTSEGKKILALLNKFTEDIFVSTATEYGGELLKEYRYKILNTKPLNLEDLVECLKSNDITLLVDASHPFAIVVTQNAIEACSRLNIEYLRYERPAVADNCEGEVIKVKNYEELKEKLSMVEGTILNTTGSRNIEKFIEMKLKNRIVHRVLPSVKVMEKCFSLGIKTEDIVAIKGPISYELNLSFLKEYDAKAIVLKDSGLQGGTYEKLKAAADSKIKAFVIERDEVVYNKVFYKEEELVRYIEEKLNLKFNDKSKRC